MPVDSNKGVRVLTSPSLSLLLHTTSQEEPRQIDQRTGKLITMHKALHSTDDRKTVCVTFQMCQEKKEEEESQVLRIA